MVFLKHSSYTKLEHDESDKEPWNDEMKTKHLFVTPVSLGVGFRPYKNWWRLIGLFFGLPCLFWGPSALAQPSSNASAWVAASESPWEKRPEGAVRLATFNMALERREAGALTAELRTGESAPAKKLAEIIQRVRPDILLVNEIDRDAEGDNLELLHSLYLQVSQNGQPALTYEYRFFPGTNTGVDSGVDLNGNGILGEPDDAFGFGRFPGQYGLAILSRYPINTAEIRTFQTFLWKDMPDAKWPQLPSGEPYYSEAARMVFRLSSKNHVVLPIQTPQHLIHFLVAHPTPPVFDGPEDRNGLRNHDEIRFLADLIKPDSDSYIVDDQGRRGTLPVGSRFVIAGDLNADPIDGDSTNRCIQQLLANPLVNSQVVPSSLGGSRYSQLQGKMNLKHRGDPAHDTSDFNDDTTGNLRVDYVLPSVNLECVGAGVFWPAPEHPQGELANASDHRLVWIDVR